MDRELGIEDSNPILAFRFLPTIPRETAKVQLASGLRFAGLIASGERIAAFGTATRT